MAHRSAHGVTARRRILEHLALDATGSPAAGTRRVPESIDPTPRCDVVDPIPTARPGSGRQAARVPRRRSGLEMRLRQADSPRRGNCSGIATYADGEGDHRTRVRLTMSRMSSR